ncbi:MAG: alpha/beta hydrolase [Candidatus Lindowbacteria bacterium]|nr:alpha/beta hydrolase [Candidatus Lindowbacteria bacterium]
MNQKPHLILLPGLLCDAALWADQVVNLYEIADIEVADLTTHDTMEGLAQSVLDAAPDEFALAGLSMGGYVAQEIMRLQPDRITHFALLDTNATADLPDQTERRKITMKLAEGGGLNHVASQMLPALVHPDHLGLDSVGGVYKAMAERVGVDGFLNQQNAIMHRVDGTADLSKISCPSLVLCGAEDQLCPQDVHKAMAKAIGSNATFVALDQCGHLSTLEQPKATTDALRAWLTGTL